MSYCENHGTEDVDVAKCLRRLGVYPNASIDEFGRERFHCLPIWSHYKGISDTNWLHNYAKNPLRNVILFYLLILDSNITI